MEMSTRIFLGVKAAWCVRLTTSSPSVSTKYGNNDVSQPYGPLQVVREYGNNDVSQPYEPLQVVREVAFWPPQIMSLI
jgi:hypothetical protein